MKKMSTAAGGNMPKSAVIRPGTGSGSRPMGGKTDSKTSAPPDKHTLTRAPKGALK